MNVALQLVNQGVKLLERDINSLTPNGALWLQGLSFGNAAGKVVTKQNALGINTVYHAVDLISGDYGSLRYNVYRQTDNGKDQQLNHNANRLLNFEPNYYQTPFEYHRLMAVYRLMYGNAYAVIDRFKESGEIMNLLPVHPDFVASITEESGELFYHIRASDNEFDAMSIPARDMIHVKDLSISQNNAIDSRFKGQSRIDVCQEAIAAGMAMRDFTSSFYRNGANVGLIIESEMGAITNEPQRTSLKKSIDVKYSGSLKSHQALVLPSGFKLSAGITKFNQQQSQFIETRILLIEEVAQIFNLPLVKMRTKENGTSYNSQEQSQIEYVTETLRPFTLGFEQEYNTKIFSRSDRFNVMVKAVLKDRMKGDMKSQSEYVNTRLRNGSMSINEGKEFFDENTIGELGDLRYIDANLMKLGNDATENNKNGKENN